MAVYEELDKIILDRVLKIITSNIPLEEKVATLDAEASNLPFSLSPATSGLIHGYAAKFHDLANCKRKEKVE